MLYTYWAFADLSFLSSTGRLGPGFFPRIVGLLLIVACVLTLAGDLKKRHGDGGLSSFWRITVVVAALSGAFVLLLEILGGPLAMVVYLLATLVGAEPRQDDAERRDQRRSAARAVPAVRSLAERIAPAGFPRACHGEPERFEGVRASPDGVGRSRWISSPISRSGCPSR